MKWLLAAALVIAASVSASAQAPRIQSTTPARRSLQAGVIIPSVQAGSNPQQSYALYLPSNYRADRGWPIVYAFDPAAKGSRPLELMKDAAERYGYILVGSNNSRNGPIRPEHEAAQAVWSDTHSYLAIDDQRVYFAGFSGAARLVSQLAQTCGCARAVFLNGGALTPGAPIVEKKPFAAFSAVGLGDFNYGEMVDLDTKLDALGQPHFLRRFDGEHRWAPAAVWEEAFAWSAVLEMKTKLRPRDDAIIATEFTKSNERVKQQLDSGEPAYALYEARALASAYDGLIDTGALRQHIAALEKDPATRARTKQEKADFDRERTMARDLITVISSPDGFASAGLAVVAETTTKVRRLREDFQKEKDTRERRVLQRVLGGVFILCMETGGPMLESNQYAAAQSYFEVAVEARPDWAWGYLSLSRCHAAKGDKKATLRDLKRALETGSSVQELANFVKQYPKLAALAESEDYKNLITTVDKGSSAK